MRVFLWIIDIVAIILCIAWYVKDPGYEPLITGVASLGGLIALLVTEKKKPQKIKMSQKSGKKSKQFQSGGDMTINK